MPVNVFTTAMDAAVQPRNSDRSNRISEQAPVSVQVPAALTRSAPIHGLRSISDELETLGNQLQSGEPRSASFSLRRRIGFFVKRRLYGFLWWQNHKLKNLAALTLRLGREDTTTLEALWQRMDVLSRDIQQVSRDDRETRHSMADWKRQSEIRWLQVESAQPSWEPALIERDARQNEREARQSEVLASLQSALSAAQALIADLGRRLEVESAEKQHLADRVAGMERSLQETAVNLTQRIDGETLPRQQLAARLSELGLFTHQTRASLSIQDRRLGLFLEEVRKGLPQPIGPGRVESMLHDHSQHKYDSLYSAFEDVFRGSREEIKARHTEYLNLLQEHSAGSPGRPVLDLGCGRGEWLELLRDTGLEASGVDLNEGMVESCKSLGLHVTQDDAFHFLASLPDASLGAITAFHMVEHMPFDLVLTIVDESLRVLKPGALLILETPNPQNLQVASHTFYLDPSHLKPLPSAMLRFFVEARGFCEVRILDLHPYPDTLQFPDDGALLTNRLNQFFYGAQDYAIIGRRP